MKLRIRDNSIRLRLEQEEVGRLASTGVVTATTRFPGGRTLDYAVESSPATVTPNAHFSESRISVCLPETSVLAWAGSSQVSLEGAQQLDDGSELTLLVEKDFRCLDPKRQEDESGMYPNPNA